MVSEPNTSSSFELDVLCLSYCVCHTTLSQKLLCLHVFRQAGSPQRVDCLTPKWETAPKWPQSLTLTFNLLTLNRVCFGLVCFKLYCHLPTILTQIILNCSELCVFYQYVLLFSMMQEKLRKDHQREQPKEPANQMKLSRIQKTTLKPKFKIVQEQ